MLAKPSFRFNEQRIKTIFMRKFFLLGFLCLCQTILAQQSDNYRSLLADSMVKIEQTNLPIMFINTDSQMVLKDEYILARMKIISNKNGINYGDTISHPNQKVDYEGYIAIKWRGNGSFTGSDKKPFAFRTLESNKLPADGGDKKKVKLLGMGKDNKWATIAPLGDRSMMRDVLTYELARPWMDFVPSQRYCEVIFDGYYYGIYILTERVSKGKKRLNLHDPGEDDGDMTGDYLVVLDRGKGTYYTSRYHTTVGIDGETMPNSLVRYEYESPDEEDFTTLPEGTKDSLNQEIDKMETSFLSNDYTNAEKGYRQYIDPTSFIDYMLAHELSYNVDGYLYSTPMYKYSNTRAKNEGLDHRWKIALWDFDRGWGRDRNYGRTGYNDWQYNFNLNPDVFYGVNLVPFYWYKLLADSTWTNELKERWKSYRESNYSTERIFAKIDSIAKYLQADGAVDRNYKAWKAMGTGGWGPIYRVDDYAQEIAYLKTWIIKRLRFMDNHLINDSIATVVPLEIESGWNADIVAETTEPTTSTDNTVNSSQVFFTEDTQTDGALPSDRIIVSDADSTINYKLQPYDQDNVILLENKDVTANATFASPITTDMLYVLVFSAGVHTLNIQVNYEDGTTSDFTGYTPNYLQYYLFATEVTSNVGLINRNSNKIETSYNRNFSDIFVPCDAERKITSITFTNQSSGRISVLAVSANKTTDDSSSTGIQTISNTPNTTIIKAIFGIDGIKRTSLQHGLNIVEYSNGKVKKVFIK